MKVELCFANVRLAARRSVPSMLMKNCVKCVFLRPFLQTLNKKQTKTQIMILENKSFEQS